MLKDQQTTLEQLKQIVHAFTHERDWQQFYYAKSISMAIAVEAAELMDIFVWTRDKQESDQRFQEKKPAVEHELADILFALLVFAQEYKVDLTQALINKLEHNAQKYPVEKCKGKNKKYSEL